MLFLPLAMHLDETFDQIAMKPFDTQATRTLGTWAADPKVWLVVLLALLAVYRFTLVSRGHFAWGDERCYLPAGRVVDAVLTGDYRGAIGHLFTAGSGVAPARPGFVLVTVVADLFQRAVGAVRGVGSESPGYYDAVSALHVVVTLGLTCLVYGLGCTWTKRRWYGLLAAAVYSLLCNANIWIRHLVPYNVSMLFGLWALWSLSAMAVRGACPTPRILLAGASTAMAYACYPGHYAFVLINGMVALLCLRPRIRGAGAFGLSALAVVGAFELASRVIGGSYVADLRSLSVSISMGDPKEGYVFAWHYLRDVEGAVGIVLMGLFLAFALLVLWRRDARIPRPARVAIVTALACYLCHASMGVVFSKMVFYGRVLMVYLPILVVCAVLALTHVSWAGLRRTGVGILAGASVYSFAVFARDYARVTYPAEFLQSTMNGLGRTVSYPPNVLWDRVGAGEAAALESVDSELVVVSDPRRDGSELYVRLAKHDAVHATRPEFIGVNIKYMWYIRERYDRFVPPAGYELVAEALHPQVFRAAWYEGRKPWERRRLRDRGYTMRVYRRVNDGGSHTVRPAESVLPLTVPARRTG